MLWSALICSRTVSACVKIWKWYIDVLCVHCPFKSALLRLLFHWQHCSNIKLSLPDAIVKKVKFWVNEGTTVKVTLLQEEEMFSWLTFKYKITKIMVVLSFKCTLVSQSILYCRNHAPLNCSWQESKSNLLFMILTYLWPWIRSRSSNLVWIMDC